jgi:hypothetical protein
LWRTKVHDGLALDGWVAYQRRQKREGLLSAERIAALESLGIQWAKKSEWWVDYVRQIKEFRALHGHQRLPTTSEFQVLRNKVSILRTRLARGTLPPALVATLDSIRFARTAEDEFWEFMMSTLKAWVAQHGPDALERRDLPTQLRNFLFNRKRWYRNGKLTGDQVAQLRAHGVRWAVAADTHHIMIRRLADLSRTFGKDNVEAVALRESDINEWLTVQLELAARAALPSEVADDLRRVGINLDIQMPSQGEAVN